MKKIINTINTQNLRQQGNYYGNYGNAYQPMARPRFIPQIPKGMWSFIDLAILNGIDPNTGKGPNCSSLTLRKWLNNEANDPNGLVERVEDTFAHPYSVYGKGRKAFVYTRRQKPREQQPQRKVITTGGYNGHNRMEEPPRQVRRGRPPQIERMQPSQPSPTHPMQPPRPRQPRQPRQPVPSVVSPPAPRKQRQPRLGRVEHPPVQNQAEETAPNQPQNNAAPQQQHPHQTAQTKH